MERILTSAQMRDADRYTVEHLGVSEDILIERAASVLLEEIVKKFRGGRVLVCVGKGNNGKDGVVLAKKLLKIHGFYVSVMNFSLGALKFFEKKYDIIIDCLFGTGLNRNVEGTYKSVIEKINESDSFVISCDIPSGLNSDTGKPMGVAVKADMTIAIQEYKLGHFINEGPDYCGFVVAKDIGISIWGDNYATKLSSSDVALFFEKRKRNVHKGNFGKVCIIGGSKAYCGSALLSFNALAALKTGRGYSYLCVPESLFAVYALKVPEIILKTLKDDNGFFVSDEKSLSEILSCDSIAFGMGVGVSEEIYKIIRFLLENYKGNLLLDADALNTVSKYGTDIFSRSKCRVVITPHIGEFARLTDKKTEDIQENFISFSKEFAKKYNITVLLKSSASVITDGEKVFINTTGCAGLAKGGSGDVLSGIAAGILGDNSGFNDDFVERVAAASYIFGAAGEIASERQNDYTITASDVISALPEAINLL